MTPDDHAQVVALTETYFEGLYQADSTILRRVFHPKLAYICATEGDELYLDLETYMARVDGRVPPSERGDPREEAITQIAFSGPRLATVTARMSMMGRDFMDCLTLVRHGTDWRIATKVFSWVPKKG